MNNLPEEILCMIFSYIPAQERIFVVAEVCPYWYDLVVSNKTFINKLKFVIYLEDLYTTKSNELRNGLSFYEISSSKFSFVPFINSVKVTNCDIHIVKFDGIQCVLTKYFKNIKELELSNVHAIPRSFFSKIFKSLQKLEVFKINKCYFTNVESFLEMRHLKNLSTFKLLSGYYLCDRHLELLAEECPSLSHLWIPDSRAVSDTAIGNLIKIKQSSLVGLGINGYLITDVTYTMLAKCQNLTIFSVEDARKMSNKGLKVLLELPKLENLTLRYVTLNTDEHMVNLIKSFVSKKTLVIY